MTKPLKINDIMLGEGAPKLCVPLSYDTEEELLREAKAVQALKPDVVEWRADFFSPLDEETVLRICDSLHQIFFPIPVIFTLRHSTSP